MAEYEIVSVKKCLIEEKQMCVVLCVCMGSVNSKRPTIFFFFFNLALKI